jgi:hypothetical protein
MLVTAYTKAYAMHMQSGRMETMTAPPRASDATPHWLRHCIGTRYRADVATKRKTPQHTVAIDQDLWDELDPAARSVGYDRPKVINQFIRWYLRRPGAKLPQRPD